MRNLKRVLGLALASVMVLSMMVVGAGAASLDDFSDKDEIVNKEAVTVLSTLNVINGKDDGSYDPTGIVTRAEMAKIICVVLNGGNDPALGASSTHTYTDTVSHWASGYIEYCTQLGIVAGDGTGKFNPNNTVTGSEAAKMLLVAAGYQSAIEGFTGANWAVATNVRANQVGLYDGLAINPSEGLSRDNAAQMVYNALSANVVTYEYTLISDGSSLSSIPELKDKNVTVLAEKFGVVTVEGVVTANEYADLNGGKAMDEGETRIVVTNHDDGQSTYTDGAKTFNVSSGKDVLGRSVTIFVKPSTTAASTSTKGTVIGSVITNSDNTVVVDSGRDSLADLADDNKLELDYTTGEGDIFATQYVTNYGATEGNLTEAKTEEDGVRGEVRTIIDHNDDGVVEYVLTESYLLGKVTTYKTDDSIKLNSSTSLEYDAEDVVGFDDVAKGDYVLYAEIGGKLYVEKAESVKGELEAYNANKSLTVDGTKYTTSDLAFYADGGKLVAANGFATLDKTATFYLDKSGYVIAVDGSAASSDYAFLMDAATLSGVDAQIEVKVALNDGTVKTYILDEDNSTGITATSQNVLCTYTLGDDNEIALDAVSATEVSNTAIEVKKGNATVTGISGKYADSDTVFFYVSDKVTSGDVYSLTDDSILVANVGSGRQLIADDVNVYVGKDNVSGLDTTTDFIYYADSDNNIKAVVAVTDSTTGTSDYIYLYQFLGRNSNGGLYNAIIDGELVENVTVTTKTTANDLGLYTYTTTSKGYYKTTGGTGVLGTIDRLDGNSIILSDNNEYTLQSDTVYATIDGSDTELEATLNEGDVVIVKADSVKDIDAIYVLESYDEANANVVKYGSNLTYTSSTKTFAGAQSTLSTGNAVLGELTISGGATAYLVPAATCTPADAATLTSTELGTISSAAVTSTSTSATSYQLFVVADDDATYSLFTVTLS